MYGDTSVPPPAKLILNGAFARMIISESLIKAVIIKPYPVLYLFHS
jgi:hypothetical protein